MGGVRGGIAQAQRGPVCCSWLCTLLAVRPPAHAWPLCKLALPPLCARPAATASKQQPHLPTRPCPALPSRCRSWSGCRCAGRGRRCPALRSRASASAGSSPLWPPTAAMCSAGSTFSGAPTGSTCAAAGSQQGVWRTANRVQNVKIEPCLLARFSSGLGMCSWCWASGPARPSC